jgi:hypothetical protein
MARRSRRYNKTRQPRAILNRSVAKALCFLRRFDCPKTSSAGIPVLTSRPTDNLRLTASVCNAPAWFRVQSLFGGRGKIPKLPLSQLIPQTLFSSPISPSPWAREDCSQGVSRKHGWAEAHGVLLPDAACSEISFSAVARSNRRSGSVITLKRATTFNSSGNHRPRELLPDLFTTGMLRPSNRILAQEAWSL